MARQAPNGRRMQIILLIATLAMGLVSWVYTTDRGENKSEHKENKSEHKELHGEIDAVREATNMQGFWQVVTDEKIGALKADIATIDAKIDDGIGKILERLPVREP